MRKLLFALLVLAFVSCKSSKNEWNKEFLENKCKTNAKADPNPPEKLTDDQIDKICDCSVEKLLAKYKTEAELNNDKAAADAIGSECAMQVLMPPTDPNVMDTTTVTDTTNQ